MARARERGCCILRTYEWSRPTLSLGRNQRAAGTYDLARARAAGVDFVRRPTGGRAVLHHREVTYSVASPASALGELRESYAAINVILIAAFRALGVAATVAEPEGRAPPPGSAPCFEEPVAGEIVAAGRKLVGQRPVARARCAPPAWIHPRGRRSGVGERAAPPARSPAAPTRYASRVTRPGTLRRRRGRGAAGRPERGRSRGRHTRDGRRSPLGGADCARHV